MPGALRLFRFFGIEVYLHWTWAVVAAFELYARRAAYGSLLWNAAEYLALFGIIFLHELGHAFACRSVGGTADRIMLWPLGGVAYVRPPRRPGALLWSIAAGPLVHVVLLPVMIGGLVAGKAAGVGADAAHFLRALAVINGVLLLFNLLPIFPLDGGQILWALLWFVAGRARGFAVAAGIGFFCAAAAVLGALALGDMWLLLIAAFAGSQSWNGLKAARGELAALAGKP